MRTSTNLCVSLLAEASSSIGTGHVVETFNVARELWSYGIRPVLWLNRETPRGLLNQAPAKGRVIDDFSPENLRQIAEDLDSRGMQVVVTNFRRVSNCQIEALASRGVSVVCIDELGNTQLDCDLVINPSIVSAFHRYGSSNPRFRVRAGPEYMPMAAQYSSLNQRQRQVSEKIGSIVITMGGVDPHATTLKILDGLAGNYQAVTKHVILGAGFRHAKEIECRIGGERYSKIVIHQNLSFIGDVIASSDIGFTVGGDTLYEMACVGTPALVLYDEIHEREQALACQARGFGLCLGSGPDATADDIFEAVAEWEDQDKREVASVVGKSIVDGSGARRIVSLLLEFE